MFPTKYCFIIDEIFFNTVHMNKSPADGNGASPSSAEDSSGKF